MISYEVVIQQLEKQMVIAKNASTEQQLREALTAVRALCDVVLALPVESMTMQQMQSAVMLEEPKRNYMAMKLEEDDANGDSIFDF